MRVCVIGTGYVGLSVGISLASWGHYVTCIDVDEQKISRLSQGFPTLYEPGLKGALRRELASGRIAFTTDWNGVERADVAFLCVGTPSNDWGETDLSQLMNAVRRLATRIRPPVTVVVKSTVPVGTNRQVADYLLAGHPGNAEIDVVSNPEFLREGSALYDSLHPDRIVVGARSERAFRRMKELYARLDVPFLQVTPEEAELIKYASNAFLALKISFANAIADFCDLYNIDIRRVCEGVGLDSRINPYFLGAGMGFGGSCFPKDLRSLLRQYQRLGLNADLFEAIFRINDERIPRVVAKLRQAVGGLRGRTVALLGLAFKPNSDDIRESQSVRLLETLLAEGCRVRAYDPQAAAKVRALFPQGTYCQDVYEAAEGADAVVIATDWPEFAALPWERVLERMRGRVIVDGRNQLPPKALAGLQVHYLGMGVPEVYTISRRF